LSPVGDVASAVENVSAAYSDTTVAPHEYLTKRPEDYWQHVASRVGKFEQQWLEGKKAASRPEPRTRHTGLDHLAGL
jgi:hypothetical protein